MDLTYSVKLLVQGTERQLATWTAGKNSWARAPAFASDRALDKVKLSGEASEEALVEEWASGLAGGLAPARIKCTCDEVSRVEFSRSVQKHVFVHYSIDDGSLTGLGNGVGSIVGTGLGRGVGRCVGSGLGTGVGNGVGSGVGTCVGDREGRAEGAGVGSGDGGCVGSAVGRGDG